MRKIIIYVIVITFIGCSGNRNNEFKSENNQLIAKTTKSPYESTWMRITETDSGYVVYNYPSLWNDGKTKSPEKMTIKKNQLICNYYSDDVITYTFDNVESNDDNSCFFRVGNFYRFKWIDEKKHIAQWLIYYGEEDRIMTNYYYVDSLYNTFPIVDYDWDAEYEDE